LQKALTTTPSLSRSTAVRNTPLVTQRTCRLKMISMLSGRPMSRLPATSASKKPRAWRGASNTMVRETSTCRIEVSHQYPASWSRVVNGSGSRCSHRWVNTLMVPGPSRSQIACSVAGSWQAANPPAAR
jgi:hypothetical protein